jgi:hypothetical protein
VALIQIESDAGTLAGIRDLDDLYLIRSTVEDLGAGRYRISGYAPEYVIPELERRGCTVVVLMSTDAIESFHNRVARTIGPPSTGQA